MSNQRIICLMGPTASGKTAIACEWVQQGSFEIVSVDSAMIYRGMDIGTAKPDAQTLARAPHHLIDIIDPSERYSVAQGCHDVMACCERIIQQGKTPLLVGGTMMYFRALQQGLSALPEADEGIRNALSQEAEVQGWDWMHQQLENVDPVAAARIHCHDTQRISRALEVYRVTGKPFTEWLQANQITSAYQFVNYILMPNDRAWLHQRIALRFDQMLAAGFIDEVEHLVAKWSLTLDNPSLRCVGYRQVYDFLQGDYDRATLREKGIAATRQLAKRQMTWLRHWPDGHIFVAEEGIKFQCAAT